MNFEAEDSKAEDSKSEDFKAEDFKAEDFESRGYIRQLSETEVGGEAGEEILLTTRFSYIESKDRNTTGRVSHY
jgi:hypothetical protein